MFTFSRNNLPATRPSSTKMKSTSTIVSLDSCPPSTPCRIKSYPVIALCLTAILLILFFSLSSLHTFSKHPSHHSQHFDTTLTGTRYDWNHYGDSVPQCAPIFEKLRNHRVLCGLYATSDSCLPPSKRARLLPSHVWMFSQFGQDAYLYMHHFNNLKRRGVYLDIASNKPIKESNSYFYDRCLGWKGVCVEGNPNYYEPTFRERSCQLVPTCAGKKDGQVVQFALRGAVGGIMGDTFTHSDKIDASKVVTFEERCVSVETILDRNNIHHVDYMSLDVEGHEYEVLQGINWDKVRIDILTVEANEEFQKVEQLLKRLGYKRHIVGEESKRSPIGQGFLGLDAIFVHRDVTFGDPQ